MMRGFWARRWWGRDDQEFAIAEEAEVVPGEKREVYTPHTCIIQFLSNDDSDCSRYAVIHSPHCVLNRILGAHPTKNMLSDLYDA